MSKAKVENGLSVSSNVKLNCIKRCVAFVVI